MSNQLLLQQFKNQLAESISSNLLIKVSLSNYQGNEKELKNVYIRKIKIKGVDMLSFTYRYKTRDIFKNFPIPEGITLVGHFISNDFKTCTLFTTEKEVVLSYEKQQLSIREKKINTVIQPNLAHNKEKKRLIQSAGKPYLQELKITDAEGNVFKNAQDKYRQINQYVQILSSLIKELPSAQIREVVDMGSGKGYLTFALYDYLHQVLKLDTKITGVEYRTELVELCNGVALRSGFDKLDFVQGSIEEYPVDTIDLLIALHACDTATDDAIYKGIKANAQLIVVAPCCHKQIRREMEKERVKNEVSFLTRYGIFMERQAEMVTDGIRALILEYYGYKTKVFEFISDAHTPKNILIVGIKPAGQSTSDEAHRSKRIEISQKIKDTKAYFGIGHHYLESLLKLDI